LSHIASHLYEFQLKAVYLAYYVECLCPTKKVGGHGNVC